MTKLIHYKYPLYAVLDKDTIKNEILTHLSVAKRGFVSKGRLIDIISAILNKHKTCCQRHILPLASFFKDKVLMLR